MTTNRFYVTQKKSFEQRKLFRDGGHVFLLHMFSNPDTEKFGFVLKYVSKAVNAPLFYKFQILNAGDNSYSFETPIKEIKKYDPESPSENFFYIDYDTLKDELYSNNFLFELNWSTENWDWAEQPCQNVIEGCGYTFGSCKDLCDHQENCGYRYIECPSSDDCDNFLLEDIEDHYDDYHSNLVLRTSRFQIPQRFDCNENKIFVFDDDLIFLIKMYSSITEKRFGLEVLYLKKTCDKPLFYEFEVRCANSNQGPMYKIGSRPRRMLPYDDQDEHDDIANMTFVSHQTIRNALNSSNFVFDLVWKEAKPSPVVHKAPSVAKVQPQVSQLRSLPKEPVPGPSTTSDSSLHDKVVQVLECPICFNGMKAPIYNCKTGHSICSKCQLRINNTCPTCKAKYDGSRNFALELLADKL